jgi:hypothetical protein
MDEMSFDIPKLKALVREKWLSAPECWPVKVLSIARTIQLEKQGGRPLDRVGGYITCIRAVRFKTPQHMEDILGFAPGSFASGVAVWKLKFLPAPAQFELRGYTQTPQGKNFDGIVLRRSDRDRPQYFSRDGVPSPYPPGLGVEQWEIKKDLLLPAVELDRVLPGTRFTKWFAT